MQGQALSAGKFAGETIMPLEYLPLPLVRGAPVQAAAIGFRFGSRGTHTSRTIMYEELSLVLQATDAAARRADYAVAIIERNCLFKPTTSTRRLTNQRLGELYGLDLSIPLFRVLRHLWGVDAAARPLLALLAALARDPLLRATVPAIVELPINADFQREPMRAALTKEVDGRLNDSTLEKVCRNAASTWAQSGHLVGRTFKKRRGVVASPTAAAFAMYLANAAGFLGSELFTSAWFRILDCDGSKAQGLALEAKRLGLVDLRMSGDIIELSLSRLDPLSAGT